LMASEKMAAWLRTTAEQCKIPYQLEVGTGGNTDATIIHLVRGGIPSIPLSIAARYIHSPVETVDCSDIEQGVRLLVEALKSKPDL
jgi:putative aminopeptidase FrvX